MFLLQPFDQREQFLDSLDNAVLLGERPLVVEPVMMLADVPEEAVVETLAAIDPAPFPAFDKPLIFLGPDTTNIHPSRSGMTIGGGCIACLGLKIVDAALHMLNDMKTFAEARVAVADDGPGAGRQTE